MGKKQRDNRAENRLFREEETQKSGKSAVKERRRMNPFLKFLLIFFIVIISLVMLIVGSVLIVGNIFSRKYLDASVFECIGIVREVYKQDEKEILKNKPTGSDEEQMKAFMSVLDKQLFLAEGTLYDTLSSDELKDLINSIVSPSTQDGNDEENNEEGNPEATAFLRTEDEQVEQPEQVDAITELFGKVFSDRSRLNLALLNEYKDAAYSYNTVETRYDQDFMAQFSDQQLTYLFNQVFIGIMESVELPAEMPDNFAEYMLVEAITLTEGSGDTAANLSLTVSFQLKLLVTDTIKNLPIPDFAQGLIKGIVPKKLYARASLYVDGNDIKNAYLCINNMTEKKCARIYEMVNHFMKVQKSDDDFDVEGMITTQANEAIAPVFSFDETIRMSDMIGKNSLKLNFYGLMASAAFPEGEVTGTDIAFTLLSALVSDYDDLLSDYEDSLYLYNYVDEHGVHYDADGTHEGDYISYADDFMTELKTKYLLSDIYYTEQDSTDGKTHLTEHVFRYIGSGLDDDYDRTFTTRDFYGTVADELLNADYKVDGVPVETLYVHKHSQTVKLALGDGEASEYYEVNRVELVSHMMKFSDFASFLGFDNADTSSPDIMSLFDSQGFKRTLGGAETANKNEWFIKRYGEERDVFKLEVTDKMLAALIAAQLDSIISAGEESFLTQSDLRLEFASIKIEEKPAQNHSLLEVGMTVGVGGITEGQDFLQNLLGQRIGFVATFDITPGLNADSYLPAKFKYNSLSGENTDKLIDIMNRMGMGAINLSELQDSLCAPMRTAIEKMKETIGEVEFADGKMILPDVFGLISSMAFSGEVLDADENPIVITADDLYSVMYGLCIEPEKLTYENNGDPQDTYTKTTYTGVRGLIFPAQAAPSIEGFPWVTTGTDYIYDFPLAVAGLAIDGTTHVLDNAYGVGKGNNLGLASQLIDFYGSVEELLTTEFVDIIGAHETAAGIGEGQLYVTFRVRLDYLMTGDTSTAGLLGDFVDMRFIVDKTTLSSTEGKYGAAQMQINEMDSGAETAFIKIITYLGGGVAAGQENDKLDTYNSFNETVTNFIYSYEFIAAIQNASAVEDVAGLFLPGTSITLGSRVIPAP